MPFPLRTKQQAGWGTSPWTRAERLWMAAWRVAWLLLFLPTPKPMNAWRVWLLRRFGARITGRPFLSSTAIIRIPWQLTMEDKSTLGEHAEVYNLGHVTLRERATVAQHAYVCGGTHDLDHPDHPLVVGDIEIGAYAFIGARALVLPGVSVGEGSVIGAGSVVPKDTQPWTYGAGNPWRPFRERKRFLRSAELGAEEPAPAGTPATAPPG